MRPGLRFQFKKEKGKKLDFSKKWICIDQINTQGSLKPADFKYGFKMLKIDDVDAENDDLNF